MSDDGFFDEYAPEVPRDQYQRPRVVQPNGERCGPRDGYTRISSVAGYLEDHSGIDRWEKRLMAKGLAERRDLQLLIASLPPLTGKREQDREINKELDDHLYEAARHAGRDVKADWGTAIHRWTEPGPRGDIPEEAVADVASYWRALKENAIQILATELFVVDHRRRIAGTFDHLWRVPGLGTVVVDKKTGDDKPLSVKIQLAGYSVSRPYDIITDVTGKSLKQLYPDFNPDVALHVLIPRGEGRTEIKEIDLVLGRRKLAEALRVREARKDPKAGVRTAGRYGDALRLEIVQLIAGCTTREELLGVASAYSHAWSQDVREVATAHAATFS